VRGAAPRKYADQGPKRLSRRRACTFNTREEVEINFDFFSGTCTSAALYGLRTNKSARFMCVDRDHSWQWVCRHIPRKYRARILYIKTDVLKLTMGDIIKKIKERWPAARWRHVKWVHASPSCRSHSQADRGRSRHRDQHGRPLTRLAKADDKATRHVVQLIEQIKEHAPAAMYTIENPESKTFKMVPCIAKLRRTEGWRWLRCSYCKCASRRLDQGKWPRKHTNILVWGVPHDHTTSSCWCARMTVITSYCASDHKDNSNTGWCYALPTGTGRSSSLSPTT
jgi:hypothetical protein